MNNNNYQKREGQGSLFSNDRKQFENQPDFTGTVTINGRDMRIAAWNKVSNSGRPYISIQISEFQQQSQGQPQGQYPQQPQAPQQNYPQQGQYPPQMPPQGYPQQTPQRTPYGVMQQAAQRPQTVSGNAPYNPFTPAPQPGQRVDLSTMPIGVENDLPF